MIIREADLKKDALAIFEGAKAFSEKMDKFGLFPADDDFIDAVAFVMSLPDVKVFLAEDHGRIVGGIGFSYHPYLWNRKKLIGESLFFWMVDDAPFRAWFKLINEFFNDVKAMGATPVFRILENTPAGLKRFLEEKMVKADIAYMGA